MKRASNRARVVWALLAGIFVAAAQAENQPGYYRYPALFHDSVVFTAEGDLWRVGDKGGRAQRMTTHHGSEVLSSISVNGQWLAFTAHYEGSPEVFVMPLAGGLPKRLTHDGETTGAQVRGWTRDGKILYSTRHFSTLPNAQLVAIDPANSSRTLLPLAQADEGCYDEAGTLYFTRTSPQSSHVKRYKGGTAQKLWKYSSGDARPLTSDYDGTSRWPMWWRGRLYFATDRGPDGTMNLWSMKPDGSDLVQLTKHTDFGVKYPSLSYEDGRIIYQNGADLWIVDIASGKTAVVPITLTSDFDQMREKWVSKPLEYLSSLSLSPNGDRVALATRGQVFVVPVQPGRTIEITRESGVRYRQAKFMGDGKQLLLLSDESGEVEFWRTPANGTGSRSQLTKDGKTLLMGGYPSPDGEWVAWTERSQELWVMNVKSGERKLVEISRQRDFDNPDLAWAPDSQWLAYTISGGNDFSTVYLYSVDSKKSQAVTTARTNSFSPAWSPNGKWLYYLSERSLRSLVGSPWGLRQPEPFFDRTVKIYQLALTSETKRSPFQPDDELTAAEAEPKPAGNNNKPAEKKPVKVTIDFNEIFSRQWEVPVAAGNYSELNANDKAIFFMDRSRGGDGAEAGRKLLAVEIKNKDVETVTVADAVSGYELSADGKKILLRRTADITVIDAAARAAGTALEKGKVSLGAVKFSYTPRESWRQMFKDSWRLHRDYFWDKKMSGVDWPANLAKHLPLVDRVTDRAELNDAMAYMMSELSTLHTAVQPGEVRSAPGEDSVSIASLGAKLTRVQGGYRIDRIYQEDPDYPEKLSPLKKPGMNISEGDIIESINGKAVTEESDGLLLRNQAGRQVLLHIKSSKKSFDAVVTPISAAEAAGLRYGDWELSRREKTETDGKGQIGYVHLRAMGTGDYAQWARDFYPIMNRPGLILDLRHNNGGNIDSWILSRLMRKAWMWWAPRDGDVYPNMHCAFCGHVVVLVDEWTASDGEAMANGVQQLGLGTVIGTRTWGGGIWLRSANALVDRGMVTAAEFGSFIPGKGWTVEGTGITPDIIVDNNPAATFQGRDEQLEAAIAKVKELIAKDPKLPPTPPGR